MLPPKVNGHVGAFSADGRYYAWAGYDREARPIKWSVSVTDLKDGKAVSSIPVEGHVEIGLSPDGVTLVLATGKGIAFHDAVTGREFARHAPKEMPKPRAVRFTPDGKTLLTAHGDTAPLVWSVPERPAK